MTTTVGLQDKNAKTITSKPIQIILTPVEPSATNLLTKELITEIFKRTNTTTARPNLRGRRNSGDNFSRA